MKFTMLVTRLMPMPVLRVLFRFVRYEAEIRRSSTSANDIKSWFAGWISHQDRANHLLARRERLGLRVGCGLHYFRTA